MEPHANITSTQLPWVAVLTGIASINGRPGHGCRLDGAEHDSRSPARLGRAARVDVNAYNLSFAVLLMTMAAVADRFALYPDLTGFGPIYVQVGGQELLLDDSRRLAERPKQAGVEVRLDVFPEMQHTFQMMAGRAPEADDAITRFAEWARPKLASAADGR
jgi:acetyl esterase/lipase